MEPFAPGRSFMHVEDVRERCRPRCRARVVCASWSCLLRLRADVFTFTIFSILCTSKFPGNPNFPSSTGSFPLDVIYLLLETFPALRFDRRIHNVLEIKNIPKIKHFSTGNTVVLYTVLYNLRHVARIFSIQNYI